MVGAMLAPKANGESFGRLGRPMKGINNPQPADPTRPNSVLSRSALSVFQER
jgi:hypothetical protein